VQDDPIEPLAGGPVAGQDRAAERRRDDLLAGEARDFLCFADGVGPRRRAQDRDRRDAKERDGGEACRREYE
jgi:hypothetical protein